MRRSPTGNKNKTISPPRSFDAVTVTLNPAIDRTLAISKFTAGKVNRVESVRDDAGGKGVNVATALADFGFHIAVTGFLGTDNAAVFENLFAGKKMADHFVRLAGSTRVGIKITDPAQEQTTDINFPGLSPSGAEVKTLFRSIAKIADGKPQWFVLGGSLPPKMDKEVYGELITMLKKREHRVLLDTSGEPFRRALEAAPNIIKPNLHELEELIGKSLNSDQAVIAAARKLIARGVELVVVSMGERGACFVSDREAIIARPPRVKVKSTVGAGDAMVAGIIAAHLRRASLEECARLSTAFSLEILTRTERGLRSPAAVKRWMQQVKVFNHG